MALISNWVIADGRIVIERLSDGRFSLDLPSGGPVVGDCALLEELAMTVIGALLAASSHADPGEEIERVVAAMARRRRAVS